MIAVFASVVLFINLCKLFGSKFCSRLCEHECMPIAKDKGRVCRLDEIVMKVATIEFVVLPMPCSLPYSILNQSPPLQNF